MTRLFSLWLIGLAALPGAPALAATSGGAPPIAATQADFRDVARVLDGKLIIGGATFYRIAAVRSVDETDGLLALHADVDPLFDAGYSGNPDGRDERGRLYYDVTLAPDAVCGAAGAGTVLDTWDFLVLDGTEFVTPREYLEQALPGRTVVAGERPINRLAPALLARVQACAQEMRERADAMPFARLALHAGGEVPLLEIRRTASRESTYEEGLGEESIAGLAYLEVEPRGAAIHEFEVEIRAMSVMHCDYEGPHLELDEWKRGQSEPRRLTRTGNRFLLGPAVLAADTPAFPAYTRDELRRAIAAHLGTPGLASEEEAAPCAPFLRGYEITIRRASQVVYRIQLNHPGGC
jgi:hypothetical protein